jgi:antitoxin FitA
VIRLPKRARRIWSGPGIWFYYAIIAIIDCMASITIRNLDDSVKQRLRRMAAEHGRSMEEEARVILRRSVAAPARHAPNLAVAIRKLFEPLGGVDLPEFPDQPIKAIRFDE